MRATARWRRGGNAGIFTVYCCELPNKRNDVDCFFFSPSFFFWGLSFSNGETCLFAHFSYTSCLYSRFYCTSTPFFFHHWKRPSDRFCVHACMCMRVSTCAEAQCDTPRMGMPERNEGFTSTSQTVWIFFVVCYKGKCGNVAPGFAHQLGWMVVRDGVLQLPMPIAA